MILHSDNDVIMTLLSSSGTVRRSPQKTLIKPFRPVFILYKPHIKQRNILIYIYIERYVYTHTLTVAVAIYHHHNYSAFFLLAFLHDLLFLVFTAMIASVVAMIIAITIVWS